MRPIAVLIALTLLLSGTATAELPHFQQPWPEDPQATRQSVSFPTRSPFALTDVELAPKTEGQGTLFLPSGAGAENPVPAVVLLHGAGGVISARELTYGPQLAAQGVAALVIDSFRPRRDIAVGFMDRIFNITEVMLLADAYAGLAYLDDLPEVDGDRVALIGFSYGGMASTLAAYRQVADTMAPEGKRFRGHVAFYAPCIIRAEKTETTGAPVLLLNGGRDGLIDEERCTVVAEDLRAGGSRVETIIYPEAMHQWDGRARSPWRPRFTLAPCAFLLEADGSGTDSSTGLPVSSPLLRRASLSLCASDEGYLIGRDDAVREKSNRALAAFLEEVLAPRPGEDAKASDPN